MSKFYVDSCNFAGNHILYQSLMVPVTWYHQNNEQNWTHISVSYESNFALLALFNVDAGKIAIIAKVKNPCDNVSDNIT